MPARMTYGPPLVAVLGMAAYYYLACSSGGGVPHESSLIMEDSVQDLATQQEVHVLRNCTMSPKFQPL